MGESPCCRPDIPKGPKKPVRQINRVSALSTVDGRVIAYHGDDG